MQPVPENHVLRRLFRGLVDNVFCAEIGLCDPELTEYVAELLVNFTHVDMLCVVRTAEGRPLRQIADLLTHLDCGHDGVSGEEDLLVHRHIGDVALFWSGVYPEGLRRRRGLACKDQLLDYVAQGKRSYAIVSQLADADASPPPALFSRLSREFEFCCHGLGLVRREWEQADPAAGHDGGLLY